MYLGHEFQFTSHDFIVSDDGRTAVEFVKLNNQLVKIRKHEKRIINSDEYKGGMLKDIFTSWYADSLFGTVEDARRHVSLTNGAQP